ncbi:MAG: MBL fold metallo-hydrolase [Acidobacteriia bacterium]|nr:MBL fold metallo-hydrolase [Terriglobia bacterium]
MRIIAVLALAANLQLAALGGSLGLVVLGSGGPRPFGRAGSSYLVEINGTPRILVDAGPGTFLRIGELQLDLDQVDTVLLTHLHIDHTGDLPGFFKARALTARAPAIHFAVFGPSGAGVFPSTTRFLNLLFEKGGAWEYQKTFGADEEIRGVDLGVELNSSMNQIVDVNGLRITAIATHHGDCPSVAYRVDYYKESIAFSGDMDASAVPNLVRLAKGCSLLVFHCAVLDPPNSPSQLYSLHTPPRRIGEAARDAGAKRLLLSHIAPDVEEASRTVLQSIRASYQGPVRFAHDKMRVPANP